MNLHDWIDELCDVLEIDAEVDEALVLDLARDAAALAERWDGKDPEAETVDVELDEEAIKLVDAD